MTMFARAAPESAKKSAVSNAPDRAQWLHAQKPARPPQYRPYNAVWPSRTERSTFTERAVGHVLRGSAGSPAISCRAETLAAEFEGPPAFAGPQWSFGKIALFAPGDPPPPPICLQRKLTIGPVNDPLEREADRVAGEVMRMPDFKVSVGAEPSQMRRLLARRRRRRRRCGPSPPRRCKQSLTGPPTSYMRCSVLRGSRWTLRLVPSSSLASAMISVACGSISMKGRTPPRDRLARLPTQWARTSPFAPLTTLPGLQTVANCLRMS
jgi:hypothetical protein